MAKLPQVATIISKMGIVVRSTLGQKPQHMPGACPLHVACREVSGYNDSSLDTMKYSCIPLCFGYNEYVFPM